MTNVPLTVRLPFVPIVTGPAITAFSSALMVTAELIVAGFLSNPETVDDTWPVTPDES